VLDAAFSHVPTCAVKQPVMATHHEMYGVMVTVNYKTSALLQCIKQEHNRSHALNPVFCCCNTLLLVTATAMVMQVAAVVL
jgi:hypothetical protein